MTMINIKKLSFDNNQSAEAASLAAKEEWNHNLEKCINQSIFATWEWGEYKSTGWRLERLLFYNGDSFVGMMQILFKNIGPFQLGWCSSGINLVNYSYLEDIVKALENHFNLKKTLIRINFFDEGIGGNQFYIDSVLSFKKALVSINSGYTIRFDLGQYSNDPKIYTSNNRYYFGKANKNNLTFKLEPFSAEEFAKIHNEMASLKDLTHLQVNEADLKKMHYLFGDQLFMAKVENSEETLAVSAIVKWKSIAYYFLAGANENGRNLSASFLMINKLIDHLKNSSVREFDFGGITPFRKSATGVNRFKIGFNGRIVRYAGERDFTHSKLLYFGFNLLLRFKKIG